MTHALALLIATIAVLQGISEILSDTLDFRFGVLNIWVQAQLSDDHAAIPFAQSEVKVYFARFGGEVSYLM